MTPEVVAFLMGLYVAVAVVVLGIVVYAAYVGDGICKTALTFATAVSILWPLSCGVVAYEGITGKHLFG